jgi:FAD/FMN-containing dehydrogenase
MADLAIDPAARTARVEAGVRWIRLIEAAALYGLAPLNGSSSDIGVVGYVLGGGLGVMARKYGFAADHVRSIEIVTADGCIRQVDHEHKPELFWALRGGKGSFGVVSSVDIDLMPVPALFGGGIFYPGDAAAAVLHTYRQWVTTLPEETTTSVALLRLPPWPQPPPPLRGAAWTVGVPRRGRTSPR